MRRGWRSAELTWQLRGTAEARQVDNVTAALRHNIGLGGAAVVCTNEANDHAIGGARHVQWSDARSGARRRSAVHETGDHATQDASRLSSYRSRASCSASSVWACCLPESVNQMLDGERAKRKRDSSEQFQAVPGSMVAVLVSDWPGQHC